MRLRPFSEPVERLGVGNACIRLDFHSRQYLLDSNLDSGAIG